MKDRNYKAARLIPFDLYDIDDFVVYSHKMFHPLYEQDLYEDYWKREADRCLRGHWGNDSFEGEGGYRWMPGNLYFYVNMTTIKVEKEEGRESVEKPLLRDIEWYLFYALTECDGFSGFEDDEEFSSYLPLGKLQGKVTNDKGKKLTKLTNAEKMRLEKYDKYLRKPNGEYKEYISPKEALYRTYDKPVGRPMYLNEMKNLVVLSSRGVGKSYSIANGVILYDFVFGSARTTEEFFSRRMPSVSVVGAAKSDKSKALLQKFADAYEILRKSIGTHPDEPEINSPFYQPFDGSLSTGRSITNSIKEEGGRSYSGTGSELWHVSYQADASAGVGFRARRMVIEEAGLLKNFKEVHAENSGTQRRETKIGYTVYIGTGGDVEKIQGIRDAFYNPFSYECVSFSDGFSNKPGNIGLFIPAYYRSAEYKDPQGNTKLHLAFEDEMQTREEKRAAGSKSYEGHIISYPIVPSEMFLQSSGNIFPTDLLETRITDLETGLWEKLAKPGKLKYVNAQNTKVIWDPLPLSECSVVKRFGDENTMTDKEKKGTIIVYEHPVDYKPELTYRNYMYLVTYDSVRDEEGGTSLASVMVWKFWDFDNPDNVQFNLVAEWIGRHIGTGGLDKDHEMAFKLSSYYNAPLFPEINLKDILRHGRMTGRWNYFLPKPQIAIDGMTVKQRANYDVGLLITKGMKPDLEKYLNDALHVVTKVNHRINGEEETYVEVRMVENIPSLRFCEELLYYSRDENFDHVSSAMLFGVAKRQREKQPAQQAYEKEAEQKDKEYLKFLSPSNKVASDNPAFSY